MGIGDWGLGIGDWAPSPIPQPPPPHPPTPTPHPPKKFKFKKKKIRIKKKKKKLTKFKKKIKEKKKKKKKKKHFYEKTIELVADTQLLSNDAKNMIKLFKKYEIEMDLDDFNYEKEIITEGDNNENGYNKRYY